MTSDLTSGPGSEFPRTAPYGTWPSPIQPEALADDVVRLSEVGTAGTNSGTGGPAGIDVFWLEGRADEGGRYVLVRAGIDGEPHVDVTPAPFDVRSRVHEYGGGAWAVNASTVVFSHFGDSRLYRLDLDDPAGAPTPLTAAVDGHQLRFGDLHFHPSGRYLVCVREDHRGIGDEGAEPVNTLVQIDATESEQTGTVLVDGHDFVSSPRLSDDGTTLAFVTWEHPDMPWDASVLWTARIDDDGVHDVTALVGGDMREALVAPGFLADGRVVVVSDRSNWWNLYAVQPSGTLEPLLPMDAEFAGPSWTLGATWWVRTASERLGVRWTGPGGPGIGLLDPDTGDLRRLDTGAVDHSYLAAAGDDVVCLASFADAGTSVIRTRPAGGPVQVLRRSFDVTLDPADVSVADPISWPTPDGAVAHGYLYRPRNARFAASVRGSESELPPLLVFSHGGPTSATSAGLSLAVQFWTTRGFAVLDVDYGGSTGYGRAYRDRLIGRWGIVDVDDCCSGAEYLAAIGVVDPLRLAIRGGSAGGYTTLAALTFRDTFAAGCSLYGIGDLELLARDTHKFESRYTFGLVAPYPEGAQVYRDRSPVHHVDGLSCPILLLQGADDRVVPPNQAHAMADAVRAKGLPVELILFEGEGHGFRRADSITRAQAAELSFYGRVFGFEPA